MSHNDGGHPERLFNAKSYGKHKREVAASKLRQTYRQKEEAVFRANKKYQDVIDSSEIALSDAVQKLSMDGDLSATLQKHIPASKGDPLIKVLGGVLDGIKQLEGLASAVPHAPRSKSESDLIPNNEIDDVISRIIDLKLKVTDIKRQLGSIKHKKRASIVELQRQGVEKVNPLFDQLDTLQKAWILLRTKRQRDYEAQIKAGGVDTGMLAWSIALSLLNTIPGFHFLKILENVSPLLQVAALMVVACEVVFGFPRRGCEWLFGTVRYVIQLVASGIVFEGDVGKSISKPIHQLISTWPRDTRTAVEQFNLATKATILAVCPAYHTSYKPSFASGSRIPIYPLKCTARQHGVQCTDALVRSKAVAGYEVKVPIIPYASFDFKDWLASLLSREGYEESMDKAWDKLDREPSIYSDIFDGSVVRNFRGPDGKTHFRFAGGRESHAGRYLFSLSFDFFNPLRNLAAGKKISIGVITLACLNLPIEERYKPDNLFVAGIIPGPKEPSLDHINGYVKHIVDEFLGLWKGVFFTCTALWKAGRMIFAAIVVVICDLPAARKIGGFGAHSMEYFCSVCWCNRTHHTYDHFDKSAWEYRSTKQCRQHAMEYKDAESPKRAQQCFNKTGIRSSELLRLPYYEPSHFLVVDAMHDLFLGLIKRHFQDILGYKPTRTKDLSENLDDPLSSKRVFELPNLSLDDLAFVNANDVDNKPPMTDGEWKSVRKITSFLRSPDSFNFDNLVQRLNGTGMHKTALVYVGRGIGCIPPSILPNGVNTCPADASGGHNVSLERIILSKKKISKYDLAQLIASWVCQQLPLCGIALTRANSSLLTLHPKKAA